MDYDTLSRTLLRLIKMIMFSPIYLIQCHCLVGPGSYPLTAAWISHADTTMPPEFPVLRGRCRCRPQAVRPRWTQLAKLFSISGLTRLPPFLTLLEKTKTANIMSDTYTHECLESSQQSRERASNPQSIHRQMSRCAR